MMVPKKSGLEKTGAWVRALTGWRRTGFAFASGAVSALGFAPLQFFPALLLGFAGLMLLLDAADEARHPMRAAALSGWAFAFGQFAVGLHWIGYAFLVDPGAHLWQMPFALLFLTAGLGLFAAIACALAQYFWQDGPARLLIAAIFYAALEWVRGHVFTGFPWNLPAYGWGASLAMLQTTAVIGAYGLSFLTILLGLSLAEFCSPRKKAFAAPVLMLALFILLWAGGVLRLMQHSTQMVDGVQVRLVQPNIPQAEKFQRVFLARNWQRLLDLSVAPVAKGHGAPTHIIWPEAAPPFRLDREPVALDEIAILTGAHRTLITGATRAARQGRETAYYNSLYVFGPFGRLVAQYDKFHLVPFGEYVPFAGLLGQLGISKLTDGQDGFASGDGPHLYPAPGAPDMTPLICYEIIFPAAVTAPGKRPGWFVNVTDDSWFGPWAGPYQHLLIARVRAIEEGVPVARAANTGISAMIDPYGRVVASLGLGRQGALDARLPQAALPPVYARLGDLTLLLLLISGAGLAFLLGRK